MARRRITEGFVGTVSNGIRQFFARSETARAAQIQRGGSPSVERAGLPFNLVSQFGYDSLAEHLRIDQDLQARYTDYEEMDEYPEISAAYDIYADDSAMPNMEKGQSIWVTSDNRAVAEDLNDMLHRQILVEEDIWGLERTVAKYGNCVRRGGRVWGLRWAKEIERVEPGEAVCGWKDGTQAAFGVVKRYENGARGVLRIRTRHREVFVTERHPMLVQRDGKTEWIEANDLRLRRWPSGGIDPSRTDKLIICTRMGAGETPSWAELFAGAEPLEVAWGNKGSPNELLLPDRVTPWFCRLFGFLLGDGWFVGDMSQTGSVSYARGIHEDLNDHYDGLLEQLGLSASVSDDGTHTTVTSIRFKRVLDALGWLNGSENKRIPSWVYGLPELHREEFLAGFLDADGWESQPRTYRQPAYHYEIANYDLARDLKTLIDGLGYRSGNLRHRDREPGFQIAGKTVKTMATAWTLTFTRTKFASAFAAENVVSIELYGEDDVFDIEVGDEAHNFVVDGVVVHNSFGELLVSEQGVIGVNYLPPPTVRRVEGPQGQLLGFIQDIRGEFNIGLEDFYKLAAERGAQGERRRPPGELTVFEDWEVVHWRLRGKHLRSVYGHGIGDAARWIWKRLSLLEDALLIYKLSRAPARYAFYVDVGEYDHERGLAYVNRVKNQFVKKKFVNPNTGKMDMRHNPLAHDEDFFIPSRGGKESTRIELLQGPDYAETDTVEYHRDKLVSALKVPKTYLGYGGEASKSALSSEDIRFARTVMRIQRETRSGFRKVCRVHLVAKQADVDRHEYDVVMSVPSAILELAKLEVMSATADLATRTGELLSTKWVLMTLFKYSDEEAERLMQEKGEDDVRKAKIEAEVQKLIAMAQMPPPAPPGDEGGEGAELGGEEPGGEAAAAVDDGDRPVPEALRAITRGDIALMEHRLTKLMDRQQAKSREWLERKMSSRWAAEDKVGKALGSDPRLARRMRNLEGLLGELRGSMRQPH